MAIRLLVGDIGGTNARLELWEAPASSSGIAPPPVGAFQLVAGKVVGEEEGNRGSMNVPNAFYSFLLRAGVRVCGF